MEADCFGGGASAPDNNFGNTEAQGDYTKNAYMLVYEKRRKQPIKLVVPEELAKQGCDGGALVKLCPQLDAARISSDLQVQYNEEAKEHVALVGFNSVQKFVPNEVYQMVHQDNVSFLFERQIFNSGFFEAVKELYEIILANNPVDEPALFTFLERLVFDIIPMSADNKSLPDMARLYARLLETNFDETLKVIAKRIVPDDHATKREYFENLLQSLDISNRELHASLLLACLNYCFKNYSAYHPLPVIEDENKERIQEENAQRSLKQAYIRQVIDKVMD